ncbi:MAG TPA: sugar transferase [Candidatus Saccharimonadales bacterium]|nr:sugar transferase [Candidatus Saccharimonadales bacterium]
MSEMIGEAWTLSPQKRALDLLGITALMPVFVPAGAAIATTISHVDDMDPIFRQTRYGLGLEPFMFYKFRTMPEDTPETASVGGHDPRRTELGRKLSSYHLDEMPQATNIYNGTMSLVGPRPLIRQDVEDTLDILSPSEQKDWLWARGVAKPAVFGRFQLALYSDKYASQSDEPVLERAYADIEYATTASFGTDMEIVAATAKAAFNILHVRREQDDHLRGESGAQMMHSVAASLGVQVTDDEHEYWRATLLAARCLDDVVDEEMRDPEEDVEGLLAGKPVAGMTSDEAEAFADVFKSLSVERQETMLDIIRALPINLQQRRTALSAQELMAINVEEAHMFAELLYLEGNTIARKNFNRWVNTFARAGYLTDMLLDARKDYEHGNVAIQLTGREKLQIGLYAARNSVNVLRNTPSHAYSKLAKGAFRTLFTNVLQ